VGGGWISGSQRKHEKFTFTTQYGVTSQKVVLFDLVVFGVIYMILTPDFILSSKAQKNAR
jgi:hypothetical protein